jgi:hypothetical protein
MNAKVTLKYSAFFQFSIGSATTDLFAQYMRVTARHKYTEHNTPKADENLKEFTVLGRDNGSKTRNYIAMRLN